MSQSTLVLGLMLIVALAAGGAWALTPAAGPVDPNTIPDSEYCQVIDGHLTIHGQPQRFWAVIGKPYVNDKKGTDVLVQRFIDLGFNANRLWSGFSSPTDYTPGDGSAADACDYYIAKAKEAGMKIWLAGMNKAGSARPEDVNVIDDPATAAAWQAAVREGAGAGAGKKGGGGMSLDKNNVARHWDPRFEAIALRNMKNVATHYNKWTGLRWCDDPVFVVWELSNEEWWMQKMVRGQWQKLPAFFRNSLVAKWNEFLQKKYGSDAALSAAWKGLLPGETLDKGSVLLAPMAGETDAAISINDASPVAQAALQGMKAKYTRADFDTQRGADVMEFFVGIQLSHKQREAAALKPLGKSIRLAPLCYDTGIGYEIQSQFLHQNAEAVAHDAYVNGIYGQDRVNKARADAAATTDPHARKLKLLEAERFEANAGPWTNWLLKPPGISQGVPWLEHNRVEGKPFLAYETQIMQAAKYRADFPLRLAALASIQDWDFVCWHYFASGDNVGSDPRPFDKPMDITTGSHPQGYHYTYDEVQNAMMRAGGLMWRQRLLPPAPRPTTFIFGRKSLYDPASMSYAYSYGALGLNMMYTTYQYGVRLKIDPSREDDQVIGPMVSFEDRNTHNPYTPNDAITFDWKEGYVMFDAPGAAGFTGYLANYGPAVAFKASGAALKDVTINNPPGIFDPVSDDQKYIAFALYAQDGQPLAQARTAAISLVSTSFNSGFKLGGQGSPTVAGKLPVLVARVGATIEAPAIDGMSYTFKDWHMQPVGSGKVTNGRLVIPNDVPVFVVQLQR